MSKNFKSQDYFRYPRLGKKWRRPKGRQSKLREKKGGSGMLVAVGYGTKREERNTINGMHFSVVRSLGDLQGCDEAIIISRSIGAKKTLMIAEKAKQMNLRVLNRKKIKKAEETVKGIAKRKEEKKNKKKEEAKKEEKKEHDHKEHDNKEHDNKNAQKDEHKNVQKEAQ